MTRLYLDDERPTPPGWERVFTASEAIALLASKPIEEISFDHDLGAPEAGDGYQVAKWIEAQAWRRALPRLRWSVHSANPAGRRNIEAAMQAAERFWAEPPVRFERDDLSREPVRALIARHLQGMHESSPPESVHAFGLEKLKQPGVQLYSAWVGDALAGCGALKHLDAARGELKSMRVTDAWLGRGIGRAMLEHLLAEAKAQGLKTVWLETGTGPAFAPAHRLYERRGFERCARFGDYPDDPFSIFMKLAL